MERASSILEPINDHYSRRGSHTFHANIKSRKRKFTTATEMWEKKAETYVDIIRQTTRADPHNGKTPKGYMREATQDPGGEVSFL
ncbi:hypothetical protein, partial [Nonomuraea sp. LPB2021202275-12-8]|uniref:hypothetical protein n=1 Tax=Nonomuraea sp. LPB2021202275-12-8 TaxID=3120159 RepID=UPI00300CCCAC